MLLTDCMVDDNHYMIEVTKQLSGNVSRNINSYWYLSQTLKTVDYSALIGMGENWRDYVAELSEYDDAPTIIWNDDNTACIVLIDLSKTVEKQFRAALQKLQKEIPDIYARLSDTGMTVFAQISDEKAFESLEYGDGLFLFRCSKKQEKQLGSSGIKDVIYYVLAQTVGKQVTLGAKSVTILQDDSAASGGIAVIDLSTGTISLQLNAIAFPSEAQQAVSCNRPMNPWQPFRIRVS